MNLRMLMNLKNLKQQTMPNKIALHRNKSIPAAAASLTDGARFGYKPLLSGQRLMTLAFASPLRNMIKT